MSTTTAIKDVTDKSLLLRTIGKNIVIQRVIKDISQKDLAELCGKPVSIISKIEKGKTNPTLSTLNDIAIALKIDLKQFFIKIELNRGD